MANTKTSDLTALTSNTSGDLLYVSQGGNDRKIDIDDLGITGTFTPTIYGTTTAGSQTYSTQNGNYTRLGKIVNFSIFLVLTAKDAATAGDLKIGGLPYTVASTAHSPVSISYVKDLTVTTNYWLSGYAQSSTTLISLFELNGTSRASLTSADLNATTEIMVSGTYLAA